MAIPTFTFGANSLELPGGIQLPGRRPLEKTQAFDRTGGGGLQVEDLGITIRRFALVLRGLTAAKTAELENWYDAIADGAKNSFTFTDPDGNDYTVRWIDKVFDFSQLEPDLFEGEITLEVEA